MSEQSYVDVEANSINKSIRKRLSGRGLALKRLRCVALFSSDDEPAAGTYEICI